MLFLRIEATTNWYMTRSRMRPAVRWVTWTWSSIRVKNLNRVRYWLPNISNFSRMNIAHKILWATNLARVSNNRYNFQMKWRAVLIFSHKRRSVLLKLIKIDKVHMKDDLSHRFQRVQHGRSKNHHLISKETFWRSWRCWPNNSKLLSMNKNH